MFIVIHSSRMFIVYVDDIVIIRDDKEKIEHMKRFLVREFEVKDLGKLKYFYGMDVSQTRNVIYVS